MEQVDEPTEAWPSEVDQEDRPQEARVRVEPLRMNVRDEFESAVAFVRRGVQVDVVTPEGRMPYSKKVWQRGVYLPFRPFYERRIERARAKATKVAGSLALEAS